MAFREIQFPTAIAFHAQGGPGFSTNINQGFSGYEQRNRNWAQALGKWQIELYNKPKSYFEDARAFWLNMGGRADAFRFKDHKDFQGVGEFLGLADGSTTQFQLQKTYTLACLDYVKPILKPVVPAVLKFDGTPQADSVVMYVDCEPVDPSTYTVDETTGIVTFNDPPDAGSAIAADFEFDYPVRFDMDEFEALVEESDVAGGDIHVTWPAIRLAEIRL